MAGSLTAPATDLGIYPQRPASSDERNCTLIGAALCSLLRCLKFSHHCGFEIVAGIILIIGWQVQIAAGLLAVFTLVTAMIGHKF
jgi:uncharacterized membrane protein YphA (DoxX/SURF4 family)